MPRLENLNLFASHYQIDVSWVVVVGGGGEHDAPHDYNAKLRYSPSCSAADAV